MNYISKDDTDEIKYHYFNSSDEPKNIKEIKLTTNYYHIAENLVKYKDATILFINN